MNKYMISASVPDTYQTYICEVMAVDGEDAKTRFTAFVEAAAGKQIQVEVTNGTD